MLDAIFSISPIFRDNFIAFLQFSICMKLIATGAEARIYLQEGNIVKERCQKNYRLPTLDKKLRESRTRREAKILERLAAQNFPSPVLLRQKGTVLVMSQVKGKKLADVFDTDPDHFSCQLGLLVGKFHSLGIVHGDLTTSNVILSSDPKNELVLIDFGLSAFSVTPEERAVDLHLLRQALESKHYANYPRCWEKVLASYASFVDSAIVIARLVAVEKRGRNKA